MSQISFLWYQVNVDTVNKKAYRQSLRMQVGFNFNQTEV